MVNLGPKQRWGLESKECWYLADDGLTPIWRYWEETKLDKKRLKKGKYFRNEMDAIEHYTFDRDGFRCTICGNTEDIWPKKVKRRGTDTIDNYITVCMKCCIRPKFKPKELVNI